MKTTRLAIAIAALLLAGTLNASPTQDSWIGLRLSQASWEPAVINEIGKVRQVTLQDYAAFSGGTLAAPADLYDYGNARLSMPMAELVFSFGGESNRGNLVLGAGSTDPGSFNVAGFSTLNSEAFTVTTESATTEYELFQGGELNRYTFGYDHEFFPLASDGGLLGSFGLVLGLQLVRDEFSADSFITGNTVSVFTQTGFPPTSTSGPVNELNSTESNLTSADLQIGIVFRHSITEVFEVEAGATFGLGQAQGETIFSGLATLTFGTASIPFATTSEYRTEGEIRTSRFHLGIAYKVSDSFAISGRYAAANRFFTPTGGTVKTGGLLSFEREPLGPFYTQKDKISMASIEFQYRY